MILITERGLITAHLYPQDAEALGLACAKAHGELCERGDEQVSLLIAALGAALDQAALLAKFQNNTRPADLEAAQAA